MEEKIEELQQSIRENEENKDYEFLRGNYARLSFLLKKQGNQIERLRYLLLSIYMDLSGMSNRNTVEDYEKLKRAFGIGIWKDISTIKKILSNNR